MVKALKVVVTLENALLGLVSKSVALVELLPEGVASAASCLSPQISELYVVQAQYFRTVGERCRREKNAIGIKVEVL